MAVAAPPGRERPGPDLDPSPPQVARRSVLKGIGVGGVTILVAGSGALSYRAAENGVLDAGSGSPYEAWGHWRSDPSPTGAVAAAILAANPHNSQPWSFHVAATSVDLYSDLSRQMPNIDPLNREHHVGLGCALENLVLALGARGYRPTVTLMPSPGDATHLAHVDFVDGPPARSRLYDAIGDRHSNRGPYTATAMPTATLDALAAQTDGLSGVTVRWLTSRSDKAALSVLLIEAAQAINDDDQQSRESFSWFRNNRDEIDRHRDGLTLDAQGLNSVTLALAKLLPASSRTAGDEFFLTQMKTVNTATAAAYGVILVADPADVAQRLTGGRLLQRIHLAVTADKLALQHMNQVTERIDREHAQQRPATFRPRFEALVGGPGREGLVTFRVGFPQRTPRRSPRRRLSAVTQ